MAQVSKCWEKFYCNLMLIKLKDAKIPHVPELYPIFEEMDASLVITSSVEEDNMMLEAEEVDQDDEPPHNTVTYAPARWRATRSVQQSTRGRLSVCWPGKRPKSGAFCRSSSQPGPNLDWRLVASSALTVLYLICGCQWVACFNCESSCSKDEDLRVFVSR